MRRRRELDGWYFDESSERAALTRPVVELSETGARLLGDQYWLAVARASRGFVRPRRTRAGVDLRVLGWKPLLLRLTGPEIVVDAIRVSCRYRIVGGLLARAPGGALTLTQCASPRELQAAVTEFTPRLGSRLYRHLQRRVHVAVTRLFFRALIARSSS
jgi:hypothetical protein